MAKKYVTGVILMFFLITAYESIRILLYEYDNLKFCITYFLRITTATHLSLPHDTTRTAIQNHRSSSRVSMLSSCSAESLRWNCPRSATDMRPVSSDTTTAIASLSCDMPIAAR